MPAVTAALHRRMVLKGLAALPLAAALPRPARALAGADAVLVALADLHSCHARLPAILSAVRSIRAEARATPVAVVINGDVFERGNVVALRSGGAVEWAFLGALAAELPLVINLGNHETAILDELAAFVARAEGMGAQVIGNVVDARTGRFYAPASARLGLGGVRVALLGLAPQNPFVWRAPVRPSLTLLDPVAFAADAFAGATEGAGARVLLSHAGVVADRAILPGLPGGTLVIGGHDHLDFRHEGGGVSYIHGASWGRALVVARLAGGAVTLERRAVEAGGGDPALAAMVAAAEAEHLTDVEKAVIAELRTPRDLNGAILFAAEAVRDAAGADVAFLGHTTFGTGLEAGPLTRHAFDAFIRFDGEIMLATVSGETLAATLQRADQFRATSLDQRTGDYVHASAVTLEPGRQYRIAVNDWTAKNQRAYLGAEGIGFASTGLRLKAVVAEALARGA